MLLSLSLITEELAKTTEIFASAGEEAKGSARKKVGQCRFVTDPEEQFSIRGVRLYSANQAVDYLHDDILYIASTKTAEMNTMQFCPNHILLIYDGKGPAPHTLQSLESEVAVAETSATLTEVYAEVASIFESYSTWDSCLLQAIVDRQGVDVILEIASKKLANPIAFFDSVLSLVTRAGEFSEGYEGSIWEDVISSGFSPIEFYTREEQVLINESLTGKAWPAILHPKRSPNHANLFAPVKVADRQYGAIGQVDLTAPFSLGQIALADHVRNRLQECISLSLGSRGDMNELTNIIIRIFEMKPIDLRLLDFYLNKQRWTTSDSFRLLLFPCEGTDNLILNRGSRAQRIEKAIPKAITFLHEDAVVSLVRCSDYELLGENTPEQLKSVIKKLGMTCAVSEEYATITEARYAFEQCRLILSEADQLSLDGVVSFNAVFENMVAGFLSTHVSIDAICHPKILNLVRLGYEGNLERGRDFVTLLYHYLVCGQNLCLCSRKLYLHRNTLAYRVEKLETVLGVSFSELDSSMVLFLELSCLAALREQVNA